MVWPFKVITRSPLAARLKLNADRASPASARLILSLPPVSSMRSLPSARPKT
jgi:hypothetical protein